MKKLTFEKYINRIFGHSFKKTLTYFSASLGVITLLPLLAFSAFNFYYAGRVFPGTSVASINLSGLNTQEASAFLSEKIESPRSIKITGQGQTFNLDTKNVGLAYDYQKSAMNAFNLTRNGNPLTDFLKRIDLLFHPVNLPLSYNLNDEELKKFTSVVAGQVSVNPVVPSITLKRPDLTINKGVSGIEVDQESLLNLINNNLSFAKSNDINIPAKITGLTLDDAQAEELKTRAEKYLGKSLSLSFEYDTYDLSDADIFKLLGPLGGFSDKALDEKLNKIANQINRDPQNPKFAFEGGRVTEFEPALDGIKVDENKLKSVAEEKLTELADSEDKNITVNVPVSKTPPAVATGQVNDLGIKELIGRGNSTFYHSIASRVHNVVLAASRINGTLVAPGETFSFNGTLGDVSEFTGYQQAYIISGGKTILGDGGGVCQVSTTLFRALLDAGLHITERQAHAYRVGYYEQNSPPGFDATVYSPSPDLKFINDTPGYILIEAKANPKNYSLVFELYGTSDGRVAKTTKPVVTDVTAPPDDLYQDDPTLPAGKIKQIDFKAWGAKVTFRYTVTRNGETLINRTYISNYRPWQAVYLRGTGPAQ